MLFLGSLASVVSCSADNPNSKPDPSGGGGSGGGDGLVAISSLRIEPADLIQDVAGGMPVTIAYRALGMPVSGGAEVPVNAGFTFSDGQLGSFTGAEFSTPAALSGQGTVTATYGNQTATTTLTFKLRTDIDVVLDGLSPTLIPSVLGASQDTALAPVWVYPEDGVVIPPNVYGVAWRWSPPANTDAYLLRFEGEGRAVNVLSKKAEATLDTATWDSLLSILGPGLHEARVYGFKTTDPSRAGAAARGFRRSDGPLKGALYYWSSKGDHAPVDPDEDRTSPRGYFRYDFNNVSQNGQAQPFLGFNRAGNRCVGCHSVAPNGTLFATSFEGDTHWGAFDVASTATPITYTRGGPDDPAALGNFNTFTPDAKWLLVSGDSTLRAFDMTTATTTQVASFTTPLPASHIAVSPQDGTTVLYVEDFGGGGGGTRVERGRIVRIRWDPTTRTFLDRQVLIQDDGASVYYPAISPDGAWLLYSRATSGNSLSNPGAEVWARRLDGTGAPILLARANKGSGLSNSWPRWAPFAADDGEGHPRYFFTFSSVRVYGTLLNAPQLWLSSFDPAASNAQDPSTPALWLPMQSLTLNNHAAQWAEVFVDQPR